MEPNHAAYYRAILFGDSQTQRPIPPGLVTLHQWAVKRNHALGRGGVIQKETALSIALAWFSGTDEGREFFAEFGGIGPVFTAPVLDEPEGATDWSKVEANTKVVVTPRNSKSSRNGEFVEVKGKWLDVRVDGEVKHFLKREVRLAGA